MATPDSIDKNASVPVANSTPEPAADARQASKAGAAKAEAAKEPAKRPREIGGPSGLEPTRYGDWERNGRVSDF